MHSGISRIDVSVAARAFSTNSLGGLADEAAVAPLIGGGEEIGIVEAKRKLAPFRRIGFMIDLGSGLQRSALFLWVSVVFLATLRTENLKSSAARTLGRKGREGEVYASCSTR